uniref:Uncharacterized protein n=1 Tax=Mesocestoides corti TaxID=53468 RepID=A0A5K3G0R4_MESCO
MTTVASSARGAELPPMLVSRKWPAVSHLRGHVVVAGDNIGENISVDSINLSTGNSESGQWTQSDELD